MWLGVYPRTGEHIVALESGEASRMRTVHRLPEPDRWRVDAVLAVRALSRRRNPNAADNEPAPRMNTEHGEDDGDRADGANLGAGAGEDRFGGPREMWLTDGLFAKYGRTKGCLGCARKRVSVYDHRQHSGACRRRIYERMMNDPAELDKIARNEERLGRMPLREKQIRRPTAPMREAA